LLHPATDSNHLFNNRSADPFEHGNFAAPHDRLRQSTTSPDGTPRSTSNLGRRATPPFGSAKKLPPIGYS